MAASSQGEQGRDRQAPARPVPPRTSNDHHRPAMTIKICLRCDWQGETKEPRCPNCGVQPLYVVGASPSGEAAMPDQGRTEVRSREAASTSSTARSGSPSPESDPSPPFPMEAVGSSGRSARSTIGFVLAALVLAVSLGTWLEANGEGPDPAESTDAAALRAPSSGYFPSPAELDRTQTLTSAVAAPSAPVPAESEADYMIGLNTGVTTPLPEAIIRSLGETAEGAQAESHYAASPDGSQLAYVTTGDEGIPQIFIAGIDGTGIRQVTHDPAGADWPAWSPDGAMIAYVGGPRDLSDPGDLFVFDIARSTSTRIADEVVSPYLSGIQFAPDGSSVVYTYSGSASGAAEMRTVPVGGGQGTILFGGGHGGMGHADRGSFSPDGSLVTMTGNEIDGPGAAVFVSNADGTQRRAIAGYGANPAGTWSPDGSQIVCLGYKEGRILVVDIATGDASPVAKGSEAIWLDDHTLLVEA